MAEARSGSRLRGVAHDGPLRGRRGPAGAALTPALELRHLPSGLAKGSGRRFPPASPSPALRIGGVGGGGEGGAGVGARADAAARVGAHGPLPAGLCEAGPARVGLTCIRVPRYLQSCGLLLPRAVRRLRRREMAAGGVHLGISSSSRERAPQELPL